MIERGEIDGWDWRLYTPPTLSPRLQEIWDQAISASIGDGVVFREQRFARAMTQAPDFSKFGASADEASALAQMYLDDLRDRISMHESFLGAMSKDLKEEALGTPDHHSLAAVAALEDMVQCAHANIAKRNATAYERTRRNPKSEQGNAQRIKAREDRRNVIEQIARKSPDFDPRKGSTKYWIESLGPRLSELWDGLGPDQKKKDKAETRRRLR